MPIAITGIILFAAALHAIWNALVKGGSDKVLTIVLVTGAAALIAIAVLPFVPPPAQLSWPFLGASTVFQIVYFALLARTYHVADMSQAYPLMRGTAPLLVAIANVAWLGEPLSAPAWTGVAVICFGILSMAAGAWRTRNTAGVALALLNAVVIAGYTLIDGLGVRRSGAPVSYTLWVFALSCVPLVAWAILDRREATTRYVARYWTLGLIGGAGAIASYGLALWAMTVAPIALVAALRETSILFGTAISALFLKEQIGAARIGAVCVIAAGAVILRLT